MKGAVNEREPQRMGHVRANEDLSNTAGGLGGSPCSRGLSRMLKSEAMRAYEAYQSRFPFPTVVPPPVQAYSFWGMLWMSWRYLKKFLIRFVFLLCTPIFFPLHVLLLYLDRRQRKEWQRYRESWPQRSVPHERPLADPRNEEFPLQDWHLLCEDGRQRWYYGDFLGTPEKGNELGKGLAAGYASVEEWRKQGSHFSSCEGEKTDLWRGGSGGGAPSPDHAAVASSGHTDPARGDVARCPLGSAVEDEPIRISSCRKQSQKEEAMWARRRFLECYQLGMDVQGDPLPCTPQKRGCVEEAMKDGAEFLLSLQDLFSGHWPNDYSGCMFLTPGLLIVKYIMAHGDVERMFSDPIPGHQHYRHEAEHEEEEEDKDDPHGRTQAEEEKKKSWRKHHLNKKRDELNQEFALKEEEKEEEGEKKEEGEEEEVDAYFPSQSKEGPPRACSSVPAPCRCAQATRSELIRYLRNYQNTDGGFGQHTEGHSTMIGSVLSYISLRLLGLGRADKSVVACREWIRREGGAGYTPTWGKVWLSILGVYNWDGVHPVPPELLLLPDAIPFSLGRSWCHSRVIAIPFSWFYGQRWSAPVWPLTSELREELYLEPYNTIRWHSLRGVCCSKDLFTPLSTTYNFACKLLNVWERYHPSWMRQWALDWCWMHMAYDDENTNFICLGPVNKSLNMLATFIREGPSSLRLQLHEERTWDYLYMNRAGMKMSGYNGSQLWDTSFAVQALCATGLHDPRWGEALQLAHHYADISQVQEDPMEAEMFYRHPTKGAWNFSTSSQGWQVSDCTAEGLRVLLLLKSFPFPQQRLFDGVDEILSLRNINGDGGWASYEPTRAPYYLELMNCAELFQDVMVEYSYAECSSSCVHTLSLFHQQFPWYRPQEVMTAIREGIACILEKQRRDGSFYGSWGVCFTYGAWIVSSALLLSGELPEMAYHPGCQKLIDFLLSHQNGDGGWGEDVNSCVRGLWTASPAGSQVVQTAWAVMAIMNVSGDPSSTAFTRRQTLLEAVSRGVDLIMSRQLVSGDWQQERISGVFNGNNPIHYPGYKNVMTVWALGTFVKWKKRYCKDCESPSPITQKGSKKIQ